MVWSWSASRRRVPRACRDAKLNGYALLAWNASWSFALMVGYLAPIVLVQSYTWLICTTQRLANGTAVGFVGWLWGVAAPMTTILHRC